MHSFRKDHTRDLRELRSALETALRVMEEHRCNQPWIFERTEALEALLLATHDATIKLGVDHFSQYCYVRQGLQRQNLDAACEYIQRVSEAVTSRLQTISTTSSLRKIFWTLFERKEFRKIVQTVRTSAENIAVFVARPQTNTTCDHEEFETDFGGVLPLCLGCTRLLYGAGGLPRGLLSPKYRLIQAKARHSGQQACVVEDSESSCSVSLPVSNRKWEQIDNYTSSPHHVVSVPIVQYLKGHNRH